MPTDSDKAGAAKIAGMVDPHLFRRLMRRAFLLPFVLMLFLAGVLVWQVQQLISSMEWLDHADQVLEHSRLYFRYMVDMETAAYSTIASGIVSRDEYAAGQTGVHVEFDTLRTLVADNAQQGRRLDNIQRVHHEWEQVAATIMQFDQGIRTPSRSVSLLGEKQLMDQTRRLQTEFVNAEQELRAARLKRSSGTRRNVLGAAMGLTLLIGAMLAFFTRNQIETLSRLFSAAQVEAVQRTALRKASLYSRSLLEASLDPLVTISRNGKITDVNEATEKVTGFSRDRLIGSDFCDYFTEPEKARQGYQQVFEAGLVRDYALAIRHTSGQVVDVLYNASVFRNQQGEIEGVFAAARDITARKQAQDALHKASLYTRGLLEASLDPLVTIARDGKITDVNEATEKVTGLARDRLIGSDFSNYFTEPEKARAGYLQVFAAGFVRDYPLAIRHTSGRITDVLYNATVFKNPQGQVEGVFAAARDITERKRAQEALLAERQRFSDVLDKLPVYVVLLTPDYHAPFANRFFLDRFGQADGKRCYEFLFGRTEPCEICETYKVLEKGAPQRWKWIGPDGRHYDIYDFPFADTDGSPLIMEMGLDITEQERAEEEVRTLNAELEQRVEDRTKELQAVNKELEAFNYAVAHDLRAPLRHIHGFSEILTEEAKPVLDESAQRHLQLIGESVRHMEQLLEDLLSLSRLGRQELSKQACGLQSLVEEVVNSLKPEIKDRQVEWRISDLPFVECDPGLMRQVITNLLTNALKFTRPRQPAIIEIGQQMIEGQPVIFVRDNGVGFSMKYVDKLFGLFQRLHRQQDFEGTGVGLAIVQRIIHRHGGLVWAEGELNKGATFYFQLHSGAVETEAPRIPEHAA